MRVAVRRMRATLKAARPLLDRAWADDLRAELGWLGRALGPVRDADVLVEVLGEHQDACVAQHLVMQPMDGLGDVSVAFVAGRLVEREEVSSMATRQSWSAAWQQVQHRAQSLELAA
jgi:CHAD domain-containing protein